LISCCYSCNNLKGKKSIRRFCRDAGLGYSAVASRVKRNREKPIEYYLVAADVLLGRLNSAPDLDSAEFVYDHDMLVKGQWVDDFDIQRWKHEKAQMEMFCKECGASRVESIGWNTDVTEIKRIQSREPNVSDYPDIWKPGMGLDDFGGSDFPF
jgi:hypothetical protein